jgi:hypothetical protein
VTSKLARARPAQSWITY